MISEIFVGQVSTADDGDPIIDDQCFVVHPMIQSGKIAQIQEQSASDIVTASLEWIVDTQLDIFVQVDVSDRFLMGDSEAVV